MRGEQPFKMLAQVCVAVTNGIQNGSALVRRFRERQDKQGVFARGIHGLAPAAGICSSALGLRPLGINTRGAVFGFNADEDFVTRA